MTLDQHRTLLLDQAKRMRSWCLDALRHRENRTDKQIVDIARGLQKHIYKDDFAEDGGRLIWEVFSKGRDCIRWTDTPSLITKDLRISCDPVLDASEIALVIALILAEGAETRFQNKSHKQHLIAADMMIAATEATDWWRSLRGLTRCRNPDEQWVHVENTLEKRMFTAKLRDKQIQVARTAANALHDRIGGSRQKRKEIQQIWATGKYDSRDICAEQECAALGMSFSSARKALRNR